MSATGSTSTPTTPTSSRLRGRSRPSRQTSRTSSPKKSARTRGEWSTDEDDGSIEHEALRTPRSSRPISRNRAPSLLRSVLFSVARSILYPLLPYVLLVAVLYTGIAYFRHLLHSYLSVLPGFLQPSLSRLANVSLPLPHLGLAQLSTIACATIGVNCPTNSNLVSGAARKAAYRGQQALSIFDHLLALGDPDSSTGLALHPVEIWELSTAIRYSSGIDDKEFISTELASLGDSVREVKDSVIGLNAQGMNAFVWIVHEFTRLEEAINRAASAQTKRGGKSSKQQEADLNKRLDALFDKIDHSLGDLLVSLDSAIPSATLASDKSRRIFGTLRQEESQTERSLQERSWIEWMKEVKGAKGKQLRRDLDLTRGSAAAVIGVWEALEETRNGLLGYRNNVGHFKAGVVGYHLSSNDLSVEDEVNSLKTVMDEMKQALSEARGRTRRPHATLIGELGSS